MRQHYPLGQERIYTAAMLRLCAALWRAREHILTAYDRELAERNALVRQDADWIESAVSAMRLAVNEEMAVVGRVMVSVAEGVSQFNDRTWKRLVARALVGVDLMKTNQWLRPLLREWSSENSKLITSIPERFLEQVSQQASAMVRNGASQRMFAKELRRQYDITRARASLIARTETAKLNGQITQARQESLGLDEYIWRDSADERVRASHVVLGGMVCKYSDPSVYRREGEKVWLRRESAGAYVGHPGQDFQCRCTAEAVIDLDTILGAE